MALFAILCLMETAVAGTPRGDGSVKQQYAGGGHFTDELPGTCYLVGYEMDDTKRDHWEPGDELLIRCELDASDHAIVPCDSITVRVTLGNRELPPGIEWPLLGLRWGADLRYPVSSSRAVLDPRFTRCGMDSGGAFYTRLVVLAADTTARAHAGPRLARLRRAVDAFRVNASSPDSALYLIQSTFDDDQSDPLRMILYAGALYEAGECWAYAQAATRLSELGYGCPSLTLDLEYRDCLKWNPKPKGR